MALGTNARASSSSIAVPENGRTVLIVAGVVGEVLSGFNGAHPGGVPAIPIHGSGQAGFKIHPRRPAGLGGQLGARKRVAAVVPGPILDRLDEAFGHPGRRQNLAHDLEIRQRAVPADVVDLPIASLIKSSPNAAAVVVDI